MELASVLMVDDDPNITSAYKRHFRKLYKLVTCASGQEAIEKLKQEGPFAVVVSDQRMPEMTGVELLKQVKEIAPQTTRIMLTGASEIAEAIDAVNEGAIFRFLSKPCDNETLAVAIEAGVKQHQLEVAEKELIEKTLKGTVAALVQILSIVSPLAFGRIGRLKRIAHYVGQQLSFPRLSELELAVMLSQMGCVTVPEALVAKFQKGEAVSLEERKIYDGHPMIAYRLLKSIPRLQMTALMIKDQFKWYESYRPSENELLDVVALGSQIIRAANDCDLLLADTMDSRKAVAEMRQNEGVYNPDILSILETIPSDYLGPIGEVVEVRDIQDLKENMIAVDGVYSTAGVLLVNKGDSFTPSTLAKLQNHALNNPIQYPIAVSVANTDDNDH